MNKLWALLKVTKSELNIFNPQYKNNKEAKKSKVAITGLTIFILIAVIFSVVSYVYMIAEPLSKVGLTYIALSIFLMITVSIIFISGIYKSQGILFASKDNDMLLSMPIKKSIVLASRLIRLMFFQYISTAIIILPTYGVYVFFEKPEITFYMLSLIMLIILPIVPTILSAIVGYLVQAISTRFKKKNIIQLIVTFILMILIMVPSMFLESFIENIVANSKTINEMITKIYWPVGVYVESIMKLDVLKILLLILLNITILILFVVIFSTKYFKIISKLTEVHSKSNYKLKELKANSSLKALFMKELKRYFSSSIYVMNTIFGPAIMAVGSIYYLVQKLLGKTFDLGLEQIGIFKSIIGLGIILFVSAMSSTTSSAISLEGKNIWLIKSLPVSAKKVFVSKILINLIVMLPFMYIAVIIASIVFAVDITGTILLLFISTSSITMIAVMGIAINLIAPKLNAPNDTVVVKQSASAFLTMLIGILIVGMIMIPTITYNITNPNMYMFYVLLATTTLSWIVWKLIVKYGVKKYDKIN